jgi:hypothetical protein
MHAHHWIEIALSVFVPAIVYCVWELKRRVYDRVE